VAWASGDPAVSLLREHSLQPREASAADRVFTQGPQAASRAPRDDVRVVSPSIVAIVEAERLDAAQQPLHPEQSRVLAAVARAELAMTIPRSRSSSARRYSRLTYRVVSPRVAPRFRRNRTRYGMS